jgi:multidrug resistance efflux pump
VASAVVVAGLAGLGHFMAVALRGEGPVAELPADQPTYRPVVCFGTVDQADKIVKLNPTVPGRVAKLFVREGDSVAAGAELLRMEDTLARQRVIEAEAALDAARAELEEGRALPQQHRLGLEQAEAAVKAAQAQRNMARQAWERKQELAKINQLNARELSIAQEELTAAEQNVRAKEAELRRLRLNDPYTAVRLLEIKVARAEALLDQAKAALAEYVVTAPRAGTVLRVTVAPGDTLTGLSPQAAIEFSPDSQRIIRAEVEQAFASLVAEGQEATVEDDTHAAGRWTGRVKHVADWFTQKRPVMSEPLQFNDARTLECLVELDPGQPRLRLGQRVRVTIQVPVR